MPGWPSGRIPHSDKTNRAVGLLLSPEVALTKWRVMLLVKVAEVGPIFDNQI